MCSSLKVSILYSDEPDGRFGKEAVVGFWRLGVALFFDCCVTNLVA